MTGGLVPVEAPETAPFWDGTLAGELRIQQCNACGRYYFYPRPFCRFCASPDVHWRITSGPGRLISFIINFRPLPPATPDDPTIIALVEVAQGPRPISFLIDAEPLTLNLPLAARVPMCFHKH